MSYREERLSGIQLLGLSNCPHCSVATPQIISVWGSEGFVARNDGGRPSQWKVYRCTSCGHLISAKGADGDSVNQPFINQIFPDLWAVDDVVPPRASSYLQQAHQTMGAPDASVVMSASSIDAMLKDKGLTEGSLYQRIGQAVDDGILTSTMAEWAHRVRLDSNNPRHADEGTPNISLDEAKRALNFAKALAEFLYVLPSRMPPEPEFE